METVETISDPTNRAAAQRVAMAMRERDYGTFADLFAPDVVLNSPVIDSFRFGGSEDVIAVLKIVREAFQELEHHELLGADDVWTQSFHARVRGRLIEGTDLMRFDATGHIRELTVFVRPLPGLAAFAAAVAPAVGRRRGRLTSLVLRLLTSPLAAMTYHGDRLVAWLLRGTWGTGSRT